MDVIGVRVVVYVLVSLSFMAQLGSTLVVTLCTLETNSITLERDERALFKADEDSEIYMRSLSTDSLAGTALTSRKIWPQPL
ncbi:hypothetical protein Hamer_G025197 [Homarus americanus]|uniref:Uncharacterized protein n=1 Tax=Homarus americanus TaxID=6706 RepID=A0A8J5N879_HOMAM|nr:hypothetical protein Hamer_G026485 [Homarus americanus]KAG7175656.1 hypothetical protein Hamer_G025197 [Homarus americanus]